MTKNKLVCAVGSRMGTEETELLVFDFDWLNRNHHRPTTPLTVN